MSAGRVKQTALACGATAAGIVRAADLAEFKRYSEAVTMIPDGLAYLKRDPLVRKSVKKWYGPARSVLVCAFRYWTPDMDYKAALAAAGDPAAYLKRTGRKACQAELVAAPGSDKFLRFVRAHFWLDYNSAAYAAVATTDVLQVRYTDGSGAQVAEVDLTGFVDQTNDEHRIVEAGGGAPDTIGGVEPVSNAALVAYLNGAITTGDSPIHFEIEYQTKPYTW